MKKYLITGGCGFIGSNFIRFLLKNKFSKQIINLDKMTYAGNKDNLVSIENFKNYQFVKGDISNNKIVKQLLAEYEPDVIVNFAAESHVDRSIEGPTEFIQTNVVGTLNLLHQSSQWLKSLNSSKETVLDLFIYPQMKFSSLGKKGKFLESILTQVLHIRHRKQVLIIWQGLGIKLMIFPF